MAKDKGTKTDKSTKADKGKGASKGGDDFAKPSDAPATGGDGWKFETDDNVGSLFLLTPLRSQDVVGFENKEVEVVVCDIVELNEKKPGKSELHENSFVFGGWAKGALRGYIGERKVLARLGRDKDKGKGSNAAWVLEDADADDIEVAKAYLAGVDPFEQSSDDKAKSKDKKGKKGK